MNDNLEELRSEIRQIQARNARVEADKAWETSRFRTGSLLVLTYVVAVILLLCIGNASPFKNAILPALGFFLSVQSLPLLKKYWIRRYFHD